MTKEIKKMIEPTALLAQMEQMERFNGTYSAEKLAENWYQLKTDVAQLLTQSEPEGEDAKP